MSYHPQLPDDWVTHQRILLPEVQQLSCSMLESGRKLQKHEPAWYLWENREFDLLSSVISVQIKMIKKKKRCWFVLVPGLHSRVFVSHSEVSLGSITTGLKVRISVKVWPRKKKKSTAGQWSIKLLRSSSSSPRRPPSFHWSLPQLLLSSILTFPLAQRQVRVVHRVVVRLRFLLPLRISVVLEVRHREPLGGAHPVLRIQQQHALQHGHGWRKSANRASDHSLTAKLKQMG